MRSPIEQHYCDRVRCLCKYNRVLCGVSVLRVGKLVRRCPDDDLAHNAFVALKRQANPFTMRWTFSGDVFSGTMLVWLRTTRLHVERLPGPVQPKTLSSFGLNAVGRPFAFRMSRYANLPCATAI